MAVFFRDGKDFFSDFVEFRFMGRVVHFFQSGHLGSAGHKVQVQGTESGRQGGLGRLAGLFG